MTGYSSRRSRGSPSAVKRNSKRLCLDSSPSLPIETMSSREFPSENLVNRPSSQPTPGTPIAYQQSSTTSAPAWSADPGPSEFHYFSSTPSNPTRQSKSIPILTHVPLSLLETPRRNLSGKQLSLKQDSLFFSASSISPDTSAATHPASTTSFECYPGLTISPTFGTWNHSEHHISSLTSHDRTFGKNTVIYRPDAQNSSSSRLPANLTSGASHFGILPDASFHQPLPDPLASEFARDALLSYAYRVYNSNISLPLGLSINPIFDDSMETSIPANAYTTELLPILYSLKQYHPNHLPVLLLLGCSLYSVGDYNGSVTVNLEILRVKPNYVEAMSNIGTALLAMGRSQEAEAWWWKAIRLQPLYWDAIDSGHPRIEDAVHVCEFVESHIMNDNGDLLIDIPPSQKHRIQHLLYTHGNLSLAVESNEANSNAISLFLRGLDIIIRPYTPHDNSASYNAVDVILAVCVAGLLAGASVDIPLASEIARALGISNPSKFYVGVLDQGFNVLQAVFNAGPKLIDILLRIGGGSLPMTFLFPEQASRLPSLLFPSYSGNLPGLVRPGDPPVRSTADAEAHKMTSAILLTLARIFQSGSTSSQLVLKGTTVRGSTSLVLLFYYLAVAVHPSPAICNNIGIILSTIPLSGPMRDNNGSSEVLNGQTLANAYYRKGLSQDSAHPHLLTNLGSLLKDQGRIEEAIRTYAQVLQLKPDFDVALTNMGNVIKDLGRPHEAIIFYQRAIEANPNFQEAICGLASAQGAICDWRGRGGIAGDVQLDEQGQLSESPQGGWINKVINICDQQLLAGYSYGAGAMKSHSTLKQWLGTLETAYGQPFRRSQRKRWTKVLQKFFTSFDRFEQKVNEGGMIIKLVEFIIRITQRRWYIDAYGQHPYTGNSLAVVPIHRRLNEFELQKYKRPKICALGPPPVPSVLPFHTVGKFTYPLSTRSIRLISYRNALRISYMTQTQSWLPSHVYPPPAPLRDKLKIGNHPLAHLMQSVFGFHDKNKFEVYVYATSSSDGSDYRKKIEFESQHFMDVSVWSTKDIVELLNLGGYTKGARNDVFAARPAPVQLQLMGFAGTLAAGVGSHSSEDADVDLDPESLSEEWMYTEHMIYMPHTFFVTDHKQSFPKTNPTQHTDPGDMWSEEEIERNRMRKKRFPDLSPETVIFANFNQLYKVYNMFSNTLRIFLRPTKIDPNIFATWIRILQLVPNSVLWLLRFPPAGEEHLKRTISLWANSDIAARVLFTDVATKEEHLRRIRIADLVLDTVECNAHTIAADVLWAGTPIITWPKYTTKMSSRVAASIAMATNLGERMIVNSLREYEERAIYYARSVHWEVQTNGEERRPIGELIDLRKELFLHREQWPLFDTRKWTRDLEKGITEAWRRWVAGTCFEISGEWEDSEGPEKTSGSIWIKDLTDSTA
ncbi:hypothetical protein Clacol_003694 [Clathrus columnatus]|uniref:protein O-GlcNAc transferase n=1 Tax=Clathrus columnatus TaxID=1419009 RepID=A0AAV5AAC7_9AGAM|nr:hypothetical protein Clacol_003694 [Clathrus columnatus]